MWTDTSLLNAPVARFTHTAVWTGNEMIVWGGVSSGADLSSGGRYFPGTNSWSATFTGGAPSARRLHSAIWTGSEMIVWGGLSGFSGLELLNTGGRYRPVTDDWQPVATIGAPTPRERHSAVWTGTEMIIWGGATNSGPTRSGAIFAPGTSAWKPMTTTGAPAARFEHAAVWTGTQMIVWGDVNVGNAGGHYCAPPAALVFADGFERG